MAGAELAPTAERSTEEAMFEELMLRCEYLAQANAPRRRNLHRIRAIINGGVEGARVLLGNGFKDTPEDELALLPWANLIDSGIERLSHILGRMPNAEYDPPKSKDSDRAREKCNKVLNIVAAFDEMSRLEMALPQVSRWIFGYGFGVFLMKPTRCHGNWYPKAELRDPYLCDPAEWGPQQQPSDISFRRQVSPKVLEKIYPRTAEFLASRKGAVHGGGIPLVGTGLSTTASAKGPVWENQLGDGVEIIEYLDARGTWVLFPPAKMILDFQPNPPGFERGAFTLIRRFTFDQLRGQFDNVVGLTASMVKMNIYLQAGIEEQVQAETNIIGPQPDEDYRRGRREVNYLQTGTTVERPVPKIGFEAFQQVQFLERQLRATSRYTANLDGESPTSFITGKGVQELRAGVDAEIRELQVAMRWGLQDLTRMLLEYDERRFDVSKPLIGRRRGEEFEETYRPSRDINGQYRVRRVYGTMAAFDDAGKIAAGANLVGMKAIALRSFREQLDGIENTLVEEERIRQETAEESLFGALNIAAQQGDPRGIRALVDMLPTGELRTTMEHYFFPERDPALSEEEELAINGPPPAPPTPGNGLPTSPPDTQTVLSRIFGGEATTGIQNVGRI